MPDYIKITFNYEVWINNSGLTEKSLVANVYSCTNITTAKKLLNSSRLLTYQEANKGSALSLTQLTEIKEAIDYFLETTFIVYKDEIVLVDYGVKGIIPIKDIRIASGYLVGGSYTFTREERGEQIITSLRLNEDDISGNRISGWVGNNE